MEKAANNW